MQSLALQLLDPLGIEVGVFRGEADPKHARERFVACQRGHQVGDRLQLQGQARRLLAPDLVLRRPGGSEIADCRRHEEDVGAAQLGAELGQHLLGCVDVLLLDPVMDRVRGGGDQRDASASVGGRGRKREAHLAAGVVADEAHGVDRLTRPARGDHDAPPRVVVTRPDGVHHRREDRLRACEPASTRVAAGEAPRLGLDHGDAAVAERAEVLLDRGLRPHRVVHGRCDDYRTARCEQRGRDDVIRTSGGDPADDIGRRRSDKDQLRPVAQRDVRLWRAIGRPQPGQRGVSRHAHERRGADEPHRRRRHSHPHLAAGLGEGGGQVHDLVGGDAARDQQGDAKAAQLVGHRGRV